MKNSYPNLHKSKNKKNKFNSKSVIIFILITAIALTIALGISSCVRGKPSLNYLQLETDIKPIELKTTEPPEYADDVADIYSENVLLCDISAGEIICEKNAWDNVQIASLTKIMTAVIAIENIDDLDGNYYTFSGEILDWLKSENSAVAGFKEGEKVCARDLLYAAMLPSAGDGAMGLAALVAGDEESFVTLMNKKAKEIGMHDSLFTNSIGFDMDGNYSNAYDVSLLFEYALQNKTFCEIISAEKYTTKPTDEHPDGITFSSSVFYGFSSNELNIKGLVGGKTGYTDSAGRCLATCVERNGKRYILITLGAGTDKTHYFADHYKLYNALLQ